LKTIMKMKHWLSAAAVFLTGIAYSSAATSIELASVAEPITMSYGPDVRNTLDLWQAAGPQATPLLIYIHGGGWLNGDKNQVFNAVNVSGWLAKGVSVASINYRYSSQAVLPAPIHDAARALQFLRYKATELNLNPECIALQGGSAGGCSTLWILFHDDLADPTSDDPVLRESTRVQGAWGMFSQTSIDPAVLSEWIGESAAAYPMVFRSVGANSYGEMMEDYAQYQPLFDEFSPINHMDALDPPLFLSYPKEMTLPPSTPAAAIHHGLFGVKLKEKADEIGYTTISLRIPGSVVPETYANGNLFLESVLLK
jgi:arylformamidase